MAANRRNACTHRNLLLNAVHRSFCLLRSVFSLFPELSTLGKAHSGQFQTQVAMNSLFKAGSQALKVAGSRGFAAHNVPKRKVVVLGAAGGIGQPISLLMKVIPSALC